MSHRSDDAGLGHQKTAMTVRLNAIESTLLKADQAEAVEYVKRLKEFYTSFFLYPQSAASSVTSRRNGSASSVSLTSNSRA